MSKIDNLTDFLTDVANAIRTKKGSEELINPQDFSYEILNLPSGSGDGTLPITVDKVSNVLYDDGILSWTPGDYSSLEEYDPVISYVITINDNKILESQNASLNIREQLSQGNNIVAVQSKSYIHVAENQYNVAFSDEIEIEAYLPSEYLNLKDDFTNDAPSANVRYSNEYTMVEFFRNAYGSPNQINLEYNEVVSTKTKIKFTLNKCTGAIQPNIGLYMSTNGSNWTRFQYIQAPYNEIAEYEYNLPSGTVYFKFLIDLVSTNYNTSFKLENVKFE